MITEEQLKEAIAECNGVRHPNADTCLKLASYYTIRNELFPKAQEDAPITPRYSYDSVGGNTIDYDSNTEFARAINGRETNEVFKILDEIMTGVYVVNPPLYKRIMRDLTE